MQPKDLVFGGGALETTLNPLVAIGMLIAIGLILTVPRDKAIVPFLLAFFLIPFPQVILVGPLHFPVLRILILAGLLRRAFSAGAGSTRKFPGGFGAIDRVAILWIFSAFVVVSLQWMQFRPMIKFVGDLLDSLGGYLVARFLIRDRETIRRTFEAFALVCVILGACMLSEQVTHHNVFASMGANEPSFRSGKVRSEGSLGTLFGGALAGVSIPMFLWLCTEEKSRKIGFAGVAGAGAMVLASHASTSWLASSAGMLALCFWPIRKQMRLVRWGLVSTLVGLHLVMHGPVWSLIEKIDLTGGSSSYHRYMLVDNCIRHFSDWWFLGYTHYGDWGFEMWDLCNQFVAVALTGGLVSLILFIAIYYQSFAAIGKARKRVEGDRTHEWLLLCLGASLFSNVVVSFGINYMIQLQMVLFPLVSCVAVATVAVKRKVVREVIPAHKLLPAYAAHT